jgi:hypothetical protein
MSVALFVSLPYFAIMVPSAEATASVLTPERETRIQLALLIAFVAVLLVAWILRPESPPDRRAIGGEEVPARRRRMRRH